MRLTGLWWWIDRWRKSTAYTDMTLEQQGAYRNLLDEAALRGGPIPNDERILAKASGDAVRWRKVRDVVMARFVLTEDGWRNATLDEVLARSKDIADQRSVAGKAGNASRWHRKPIAKPIAKSIAKGIAKPIAPDPDPDPYVVPSELRGRNTRGHPPLHMHLRRLKIWRWMIDEFIARLGSYAEEFDLDAWIRDRDEQETRVIQGDGWWEYWLSAFDAEVRRRGLPIVATPQLAKSTTRLAAALANIAASEKA